MIGYAMGVAAICLGGGILLAFCIFGVEIYAVWLERRYDRQRWEERVRRIAEARRAYTEDGIERIEMYLEDR